MPTINDLHARRRSILEGILGFAVTLMLIFTPLQNDPDLENATTISKTLFFASGILVLALPALIISIMYDSGKRFRLTRIDLVVGMFAMYILTGILLRHDFRLSARIIDLIAILLFYIMLRRRPLNFFLPLLYAVSASGIIQSGYGLLQVYNIIPSHSPFRLTGTFFNLGAYAAFISLCTCSSVTLVLFFEKQVLDAVKSSPAGFVQMLAAPLKIIPWLNVALAIIVLPMTYNRTAWITVLLAASCMYVTKTRFRWFPFKKRVVGYLFFSLLAVVLLTAAYLLKRNSADGRVLIWKATAGIIKDRPIFGIGYDQFGARYMNYQGSYMETSATENEKQLADNVYYAFNDPLQLTAELGTVGLLLIIALVICCLSVGTGYEPYKYAAQGLLLAYVVTSLFYYPHFILPLKIVGAIALAMLAAADQENFLSFPGLTFGRKPQAVLFLLVLVLSVAGIRYLGRLADGYRNWQKAQTAYETQSYQQSLRYFNRAFPVLSANGEFLSGMGKAYLNADSLNKAGFYLEQSRQYLNNTVIEIALGDIKAQKGQFAAAESHYQAALDMVPNRFYSEFMLLKLYAISSDSARTCSKAAEILHKQVKVPSTAVRQILDSASRYYANYKCSQ
ncbi:O-antigen ligase [Chitinophaga japonensis]|uniref:O-antigen ligase n=2 Tax=Chitinophaga japonensis TaxID=104662 RepID=A0A562T5K2_CHIJA|nr:O-antigen ligase [Chitinophaga japonensis]